MKVTALLPDDMVRQVQTYSHGRNLTESLVIAIGEWIRLRKIKQLNERMKKKPLRFQAGFSAEAVRSLNRRS